MTRTFLSIPHRTITQPMACEELTAGDPLAMERVRPLFEAGFIRAAITECIDYFTFNGPNRSKDHRFTLLLQGRMQVRIENHIHQVEAGNLIYCKPGTLFERSAPGESWWISFDIKDVPEWAPLKHGSYVYPYQYMDIMYVHLRHILDKYQFADLADTAAIQAHANAVMNLLKLEFHVVNPRPERQFMALMRLVDEIAREPQAPWSLASMADRLHVSQKTLMRMMRTEYNQTPLSMVIGLRLDKARNLLYASELTVDEISQSLNYESTASFCHLFKKHIGITPGQYRKRSRRHVE